MNAHSKICATAIAGMMSMQSGVFAAESDVPAPAPVTKIEKVVVKTNAQFDFDKDQVKPDDQQRIISELGAAGNVTWQSVNAVGYTDSIGTAQYNQGLSERRAQAIKSYLVSKGVMPAMIVASGKAAKDPVASNDSDEGRALNRRTAIEFQGVKAVDR